jgi:S-DNA-T family DNA segregation ATPase FtsK/SpoIIIE
MSVAPMLAKHRSRPGRREQEWRVRGLALLAAQDAAPPDGMSAEELAARVGRSRAWVFSRLDVHASAGRAVRLRRGRWTGGGER